MMILIRVVVVLLLVLCSGVKVHGEHDTNLSKFLKMIIKDVEEIQQVTAGDKALENEEYNPEIYEDGTKGTIDEEQNKMYNELFEDTKSQWKRRVNNRKRSYRRPSSPSRLRGPHGLTTRTRGSTIDIKSESRNLWIKSNWNGHDDVEFTSCHKILDPRFCSDRHNNVQPNRWNTPFARAFTALLDFYDPFHPTGRGSEANLISAFLNAFMDTDSGKELYRIIYGSALSTAAQRGRFSVLLKELWFGSPPSGRRVIGFRHVFVGEKQDNRGYKIIKGFHNWYQFDREFCLKPRNRFVVTRPRYIEPASAIGNQPSVKVRYCNIAFTWDGYTKGSVNTVSGVKFEPGQSTILFGSRPEYDFAVFTLCFLKHKTAKWRIPSYKCSTDIDSGLGKGVNIQVYKVHRPSHEDSEISSTFFT